ncbi:MAG: response regulator transcription factor [Candidatus Hydrogenedentes bacterium]|nr:response regulator transcription factor [Candidatus Hydrogenedentota bacterium]
MAAKTPRAKKKRILIVDDHPVVRRGFASLINLEPDLEVCGGAEDAQSALEAVKTLTPDLLIVDIFLKDSSGLDLIKALHKRGGIPILVVSMHDETLYADRVLRAGAMGYVMKREAERTIVTAIRRVLEKKTYLSERMAERLVQGYSGQKLEAPTLEEALSDRELQIFEMLGHGHGIRKIAEELNISLKTVDAHRSRIKEKLNVQTSTEVLQRAVQWVQQGNRGAS